MTSSFGVVKPDRHEHCHQDNDEHEIVFPLNGVKRNGVDEYVEEDSGERGQKSNREPLGTQAVGPNLDRIGNQKWSEGDVISKEVAVDLA